MIGKNKRAERSSLQVKGTLSSMTVKLADLNAKTFTPPVSVLKAAKSATKHIIASYNSLTFKFRMTFTF
jgi:hypothetical protein